MRTLAWGYAERVHTSVNAARRVRAPRFSLHSAFGGWAGLGGRANGNVSGTTRTPVVILSGTLPIPGKVISTKKAVQPFGGFSTFATYSPLSFSSSGALVHTAPIFSSRKSRASGLFACHSFPSVGFVMV